MARIKAGQDEMKAIQGKLNAAQDERRNQNGNKADKNKQRLKRSWRLVKARYDY